MKQVFWSSLFGLVFGIVGAGIFYQWMLPADEKIEQYSLTNYDTTLENAFVPHVVNSVTSENTVRDRLPGAIIQDFSEASFASTNSVVFIQTSSEVEYRGGWADWFFEPRSRTRVGSGSGVIMTADGYIVTNNHVIEDADIIKVIHGKNSYLGTIVGTDPSTDLAVIKIEANGLPKIGIGNSEQVKVGEWVLAVGNPFNLESTVTAGIVSAKGRNINILKDKFPIESFIQTDAAINPGNSGGALVNIKGELIGINTAILSQTGSYAGYGFAVPVNIVNKVFNDIKEYGQVQKAFFGAEYIDITSELAGKLDIKDLNGVFVAYSTEGSSADKVGIRKGDIILKVNGQEINSKGYLEEIIGNSYPGDVLNLTIDREGKILSKTVTLTNKEGTTALLRDNSYYSDIFGATFITAPKVERDIYGISRGVKVVDVDKDGFFKALDIPKNQIITAINGKAVESPEELENMLKQVRGIVYISVISENGRRMRRSYRM